MRYILKPGYIGIGTDLLPGRKRKSLVYINGNTETVIGTVTDEELFDEGMRILLRMEEQKEQP